MDRNELIKLIPLYVANSLSDNDRKLVEREIASSEEMKEDLRFWKLAHEVVRAHLSTTAGEHPSSEAIVTFVLGLGSPESRAIVDTHLISCEECRSDVQIIQDIHEQIYPHEAVAKPAGGKQIPHRTEDNGISHRWRSSRRIIYAVPVLATIIVLFFLLRPSPSEPPPIHEEHQFLTLLYRVALRDPGSEVEIPILKLNPMVTHIDFIIQIPKSGLEAVRYSASLLAPTGTRTMVSDSLLANTGLGQFDTLRVQSQTHFFHPHQDPYELIVTEILPSEFRDLTPEEYRYSFVVSDSSKQVR